MTWPERCELLSEDWGIVQRYWELPGDADRDARRRFLAATGDELRAAGCAGRDDAIDAVLLAGWLRHELTRLDEDARRDESVADWLPFAGTVLDLAAARRRGERPDGQAAATALESIRKAADKRREALATEHEQTPVDRVLALRAARRLERLIQVLASWHAFGAEYDPLFTWWTEHPQQAAKEALDEYLKLLREECCGLLPESDEEAPLIGEPIGRAALLAKLERSWIAYSPEELIAVGEGELAWCLAELRRVADELGLGDDWRAAVEQAKGESLPPGEQPALIRRLADEATEFVTTRELVTVPPLCRELWRMEMMSPERQRITPYFTGGEVISVSYPTAGMDHAHKQMSLRGNNPAFCRATVHHELIPGHHLQLFHLARYRRYRRFFRTAFLVEGWCLHWEMRFWELGFARTPLEQVGMLFWRLHRAARVIFSLRFHLGEWDPEACVAFLVGEVGHEEAGARAEVRRSIGEDYEPLYQCAYLIGGLQMHALWRELVGGGTMAEREFHDAVLRQSAIPIELIRCALTETPPGDGPSWRFVEVPAP